MFNHCWVFISAAAVTKMESSNDHWYQKDINEKSGVNEDENVKSFCLSKYELSNIRLSCTVISHKAIDLSDTYGNLRDVSPTCLRELFRRVRHLHAEPVYTNLSKCTRDTNHLDSICTFYIIRADDQVASC